MGPDELNNTPQNRAWVIAHQYKPEYAMEPMAKLMEEVRQKAITEITITKEKLEHDLATEREAHSKDEAIHRQELEKLNTRLALLEDVEQALIAMVEAAGDDGWAQATTGKQSTLAAADKALSALDRPATECKVCGSPLSEHHLCHEYLKERPKRKEGGGE